MKPAAHFLPGKAVRRVWPFAVSVDKTGKTTVTLPPSKPKRNLAELPAALF